MDTTSVDQSSSSSQPSNLQDALAGLNVQISTGDSNGLEAQNTELLTLAATSVVSFVFVNKQASLFNLLIQMLSTNKFTPIQFDRSNSFSNIPFKGSPNPATVSRRKVSMGTSAQPQVQQQQQPQTPQQPNKSALMFNVLNDAINAVSQQYNTNFYIHILDKKDNAPLPTNDLLSGCLSFINHMMSVAPTSFEFERYRQSLSAQGVNDVIKKYVKNLDPHVRSELLHYQKHRITSIKAGKQINERQPLEHLLNRFVKVSFPSQSATGDESIVEEKIKALGFDSEDPIGLELMNTGILGLRNLIYFGARYSRIYQEILNVQLTRDKEGARYSFAQVGMSLTNVIYEIYIDDENIYEIIFDQDDWFEELFSISFELYDEIWEREAQKPEDFLVILQKTRNILSRIKWTNPDSIHGFQVTLGSVLDEIFTKPEHPDQVDERRQSVGLSDSILGLPTQNYHTNTYRFQKFLNERLDKFRTIRKDSNGSNNSFSVADDDTSSNASGAPDSPMSERKPSHLRNHTKSMSFKKLFTDIKSLMNNSEAEQQQHPGEISPNGTTTAIFSERPDELTSGTTDDNHSTSSRKEGDSEKSSLERIARKLKKSVSLRIKGDKSGDKESSSMTIEELSRSNEIPPPSPKLITLVDEANISSNNTAPVEFVPVSSNSNNSSNNNEVNLPSTPMGSLKSSGTAIYKTVKKAMHSLEKKGHHIKERVKKNKKNADPNAPEGEKKKKKKKKVDRVSYEKENEAITIHPNNLQVDQLTVPFQPSLDLNFDENDSYYSGSSDEYTDDETTNTIEDDSDHEPTPVVTIVSDNNEIVIEGPKEIIQSTPTKPVVVAIEQPKPTTTTTTLPPKPLSKAPSTSKLPSIIVKEEPSSSSSSTTPSNSSTPKQVSPSPSTQSLNTSLGIEKTNTNRNSVGDIQPSPIKTSTSTGDIQGEAKVSNRRSIYGVNDFTKGPFGTIERRKSPTNPVVKSASIKHLVSFFETKQETSTPPSPKLERQRSFKGEVDKNNH